MTLQGTLGGLHIFRTKGIAFYFVNGIQLTDLIRFCICSSIDESTKEKLAPFSSLTGDESYQSRDLEKVHT